MRRYCINRIIEENEGDLFLEYIYRGAAPTLDVVNFHSYSFGVHDVSIPKIILEDTVIYRDISEIENGNKILIRDDKFFTINDGVLYSRDEKILIEYPISKKDEVFVIPSSVANIGEFAFGREPAVVNQRITSLEKPHLKKIIIPNSVTCIGDYAFYGAKNLTEIIIPNSVIKIGDYAFSNSGLEKVIFEENSKLTSIGNSVFSGTRNLTKIEIPNNVSSIGNNAFSETNMLRSIFIPNGVTEIGEDTFTNSGLETIIFEENSKLTSIGDRAFSGTKNLTKIEIPNSLTSIGREAFKGSNIILIKFEKDSRLRQISEGMFSGASVLKSIEIPKSVEEIKEYAFYNAKQLNKILFEKQSKLTRMRMFAFTGTDSLESLDIPENMTSIGEQEFDDSGLKRINIHENVNYINVMGLRNLPNLEEIVVAKDNDVYKSYEGVLYEQKGNELVLFPSAKDTQIFHIPNDVRNIGRYAFQNAFKILEIVFPDKVFAIRESAFQNAINLKKVIYSKNSTLSLIGNSAFEGLINLEEINIPNSVEIIQFKAFFECVKIRYFHIPKNVKEIESYVFAGTSSLQGISVSSENPNFLSIDGVLFNKDMSTLICYPSGKHDTIYTIPNSVIKIEDGAFANSSLVTVIFEENSKLTSIGDSVFSRMNNLKKIVIPSGVKQIGDYSFSETNDLTVVLPKSIKNDLLEIFYNSTNLTIFTERHELDLNVPKQWTLYCNTEWHYDFEGNPLPKKKKI